MNSRRCKTHRRRTTLLLQPERQPHALVQAEQSRMVAETTDRQTASVRSQTTAIDRQRRAVDGEIVALGECEIGLEDELRAINAGVVGQRLDPCLLSRQNHLRRDEGRHRLLPVSASILAEDLLRW